MADTVIENVSDTAFWIAHYRAMETERPDALFHDPLAGVLAGDRGKKIAQTMPMPFMTGWAVVIRTCIVDDYIRFAIGQGVDAVLNLGAGLDTRPYRMDLPESLVWIEADYPHIIEFKEKQLSGEKAHCQFERVKLDLANLSERRQMFGSINTRARKMLVLTEGVVPYLSVEEVGCLAIDLKALDHACYWIVDYFSPEVIKFGQRRGMARKMRNAPFRFTPKDWFGFFGEHGWRPKETRYLTEEGNRLERPIRLPLVPTIIMKTRALVTPKKRREAFRKSAGYILLERATTVPSRATFESAYTGKPPWDIGRPQPVFQAAAHRVIGSVLDAGCGTGENALFLAARGHRVTGFDFLEEPITSAKRKAVERGLAATFMVKDALNLLERTERFDNIIDSGLFHVFSDADRLRYLEGLKTVLKPGGYLFLLCFSDETPGTQGPRRVSKNELREAFGEGWEIESIEPARFEVRPEVRQTLFSGDDPKAWFMVAKRLHEFLRGA